MGDVAASPSQFQWHREILLGDNTEKYFYLLITMTNTGTYYQDFESTFVCERSRENPRMLTKTMARVTVRSTDGATGKTDYKETVGAVGLFRLLSERKCQPAYYQTWPESVACDERGLYVHSGARRSYFMDEEKLREWGSSGVGGRTVEHLETRTREAEGGRNQIVYFLLRSGDMDDGGQSSGIVPVPRERLRNAFQDVNRPLNAPDPGTLKR